MAKSYWLMKTEEDVYSIDDLERDGSTCWEGVRSYEARNNMQAMKVGDEVLIYHSNAKVKGVAGVARVCKEAYPDHFAFNRKSAYFDAKSDESNPRWYMVDVEFVQKLDRVVPLAEIRERKSLSEMDLLKKMRLSVQSVRAKAFKTIVGMGSEG